MDIRSASFQRAIAVVLALLGWSALVLQFVLHLDVSEQLGVARPEALIRFFSYFTIQVNILAAAVLTAYGMTAPSQPWRERAFIPSGVAVYIATVGLGYSALLRHLRPPTGMPWLADFLLHDVMPLAFFLFWVVCVRKARLRWTDPLLWLIYPIGYLAVILVRGEMSNFYPYPFINVATLGYASVAVNAAGLLIFCAALGAVFVGVGRGLARRRNP